MIALNLQWRQQPKTVLFHLPWFAQVTDAVVDGKTTAHANGVVRLPLDAREVRLTWTRRIDTPVWSYDEAIANYKKEYQRRYEIYLQVNQVSDPSRGWRNGNRELEI